MNISVSYESSTTPIDFEDKGKKIKMNTFESLNNLTAWNLNALPNIKLNMIHSKFNSPQRPNKNDEKIFASQKKIQHVFTDAIRNLRSPYDSEYDKYKNLLNLTENRIKESLKKIPPRRGSLQQNSKIRNLQLPVQSISSMKDSRIGKDTGSIRMPDLLKIKLKKQLQTIQKSEKNKCKFDTLKSQKSYFKTNTICNILFDSKHEKILDQNETMKSKSKVQNKMRFENLKKYGKRERSSKAQKRVSLNDINDVFIRQKRTITEETDFVLNDKRRVSKYSHLLDYAKQIKRSSNSKNQSRSKGRINTETAEYSSLMRKGLNLLQLQGIHIKEDPYSYDEKLMFNILLEKSISLKEGLETLIDKKPRQWQSIEKKLKTRMVKSEAQQEKWIKSHQISPWVSAVQNLQNSNSLMFNDSLE